MPQIWPMNWVILFIFFTLTFIVTLSLIYFFTPTNTLLSQEKSFNLPPAGLEWKW